MQAVNKRMSSVSRLKQLPPVFRHGNLLLQQGASQDSVKVMLSRWAAAGLVEPLGGRSGIYFNLIADPTGPETRLSEAIQLRFPEAIVCGPSVLHQEGWITQIPQHTHIAVLKQESQPNIRGIALHERTKEWFVATHEGIIEHGLYGLPSLKPAWAMEDMLVFERGVIGIEDVDEDCIDEAELDCSRARAALSPFDTQFRIR